MSDSALELVVEGSLQSNYSDRIHYIILSVKTLISGHLLIPLFHIFSP
jgi:hypothetical protein